MECKLMSILCTCTRLPGGKCKKGKAYVVPDDKAFRVTHGNSPSHRTRERIILNPRAIGSSVSHKELCSSWSKPDTRTDSDPDSDKVNMIMKGRDE